ncbi:type IV secretory system conjugative DNA transfer family protein [Gymnodinialimonas sp.]
MSRDDNASNRFGSTRPATYDELLRAGLFEQHPHSIFLGFFEGREVYTHGPAGTVVTAGARSGKLRDLLIFNLLSGTCLTSSVTLDPKGEAAYIAQDQTADGKFIATWNPTGWHGLPQDRINFLGHIKRGSPMLVSDTKVLWQNLIPVGGPRTDKYFPERGQEFGEALSLAIVELEGELSFPSLYRVINMIPTESEEWLDFAFHMSRSEFPVVRRVEAEIAASRKDTGNGFRGIIGELMRAVACLSDPLLMASVSPPYTMKMEDLVASDQIWQLYLCPPAEFISGWSAVIKAAFVSAMLVKSRAPAANRITFFIDECGQFGGEAGGFPLIPRLFTYGAGIGCVPVIFLQSNAQMNGLAPGAKDLILSSAGASVMFALRGDWESCQDCSRRMGAQTLAYDDTMAQERAVHARNQAIQSLITGGDPLKAGFDLAHHGFAETHQTKTRRELRTPDEIMNMPSNKAYLFHEDVEYPIELERRPYYEQRSLTGKFHPHPAMPPLDRVTVATRWGKRTRRVITEPVPARFAHYPQYRNGLWSRVES